MSTSCAPASFPGPCLFFFDCVQQGIGYPEVLYRAASNITLFQFPKLIAIRIRLINFSQRDVHEIVAVDEMTVESLAVLEFDQHRFVLGRI